MSLLRDAQRCIANQAAHTNLKAFINLTDNASVLRAAAAADSNPGAGPLHGKLIALKDNICTSDLATTAASGVLDRFRSPYDASVVSLLRNAGAIVAGKTNLDEFGMGSHSMYSHFGAVKQCPTTESQPVSAGGSSGGSAVAVATQQCWAALGTDTGGSVRLPAAYNGIVGFKPSYGLISRWGVIAYANSLDTVGILGRDVGTVRHVLAAVNKHDTKDPTNLTEKTRAKIAHMVTENRASRRLRIGIPVEYNIAELHALVRETWSRTLHHLARQGHELCHVSLPHTRHALSAYYVLAPAESSSNLAKYDGVRFGRRQSTAEHSSEGDVSGKESHILFSRTRTLGFGDEVKRRIVLGSYSLSADAIDNYFIQAQRVRRVVQTDFDRVFHQSNPLLDKPRGAGACQRDQEQQGIDVLVCPTAPSPPPTLDALENREPVEAYMNDVFTVPASLAGLPSVSVPAAPIEGERSHIGIQVVSQYGLDDLVLDVAELIMGSHVEER